MRLSLPVPALRGLAVPRLRLPLSRLALSRLLPPRLPGLRAVGAFWAVLLVIAAAGAGILQLLGPPASQPAASQPAAGQPAAGHEPAAAHLPHAAARSAAASSPVAVPPAARPGRDGPGGPIVQPDPKLLEPYRESDRFFLPKLGADGRAPGMVYARGFDRGAARPRVAVIVAGVGTSAADSEAAIRALPPDVTLAFSPYAYQPDRLLDLARDTGHEFLVSLPMEPQGYPLNDPGDHALLTGSPPEQNRVRLDWTMSRIAGYAGVTNALGVLRGERFAGSPAQMTPVLEALRDRGLFYIDARPGKPGPTLAWGRSVDVVIDEPAERAEIEARLAQLEQVARDRGSAVGLVGAVRPVTMDRLLAWCNGLAARGIALAPASAVVQTPGVMDAGR
jgi:polysaccharide deacetylase 2 family uncharacterized protein YibQ